MKYKFIVLCSLLAIAFGSGALISASAPTPTITLTPANFLTVDGEISTDSMADAQRDFLKLISKRGNLTYSIYVVFNSGGGSVFAGLSFYELVKTYPNVHSIIIVGYSMAGILPQLLPGHRYVLESSRLLYHPMKMTAGPLTNAESRNNLEYGESLETWINSKVASRANLSLSFFTEKAARDWMLTAQQAIELRLADSIVSIRCSAELLKLKSTKLVQVMPFLPPISVTVSKCPLQL